MFSPVILRGSFSSYIKPFSTYITNLKVLSHIDDKFTPEWFGSLVIRCCYEVMIKDTNFFGTKNFSILYHVKLFNIESAMGKIASSPLKYNGVNGGNLYMLPLKKVGFSVRSSTLFNLLYIIWAYFQTLNR